MLIRSDMNLVQDGISQKVGLFFTGCAMFVAAIAVGFTRAWKLALIMLSSTVATLIAIGVNGKFMRSNQVSSIEAYARTGTLAEEVLSSTRNVTAYGTQKRLDQKYGQSLVGAAKLDFKGKFFLANTIATLMCILNLNFGLAFWQGNQFFHRGELSVAQILTTIMTLLTAGVAIGRKLRKTYNYVTFYANQTT